MVHFYNCLWYSSLLALDRQQFRGGKWNARCADESSVAVKMEAAAANDMSEPQHNGKSKPHKCTVCNKRFATKGNLSVHIQMHTEQKSYSCPECEKCYNSSNSLRQHMYIHSSKYKCSECGKCFHSNCALKIHRRTHSGAKLFECRVCSKRFAHGGHLTVHSRSHSGEKPYKCQVCHQAFSESNKLTCHMIVHGNRRPYYCPYCGKLFKTASHLRHHSYVHTGAKPFSCRHCSECFRYRITLKSHLRRHTIKEVGSRVIFARRSLVGKVTLRTTCSDTKVWSRMFAMSVQSVSVQHLNWDDIRLFILTSKSFAVVFVSKTSNDHRMLNSTLEDVLMSLNLMTWCCEDASVYYTYRFETWPTLPQKL